ncbi:MAG TPA: hypothetical protein PLF61_01010 [Candidatus Goldiibacteriota bacterium]|nr:hypothetical protein [Candidatus Goldiibacteriota bacterium]
MKKNKVPKKLKFVFLFILLIMFFTSMFFYKQMTAKPPDVFIQKPINKVRLPSGSRMKLPSGFTAFESKINNAMNYNFVQYVPEWKNNNFVKIDLTVINRKYLNVDAKKFGQSGFDFDEKIIQPKVNLSDKLKKLRGQSNEDGQIYDVDYSGFKPQYAINGTINNRTWRRYTLQSYEIQEDGKTTLIKLWNNLYTIYKDYVYIFDYVCYAGIKVKNNKYGDEYSESANGIDKFAQELILSIEFK